MKWLCLPFQQLNVDQLYELLKLRSDVFVVEQNCPYPDLDNHDRNPETRHLLGYKDHQLIAYLRILPAGTTYQHVALGRILIAQSHRKQGLAHRLMTEGLVHTQRTFRDTHIEIGAQLHLQAFYQEYQFVPCSKPYVEDGIPHIDMRRAFTPLSPN